MVNTLLENPLQLAVLNPGGRDEEQYFPEGCGSPWDPGHPPVNFHAFAACTAGSFHRKVMTIPDSVPVLLLLRKDLKPSLLALRDLKARGHRVAISWKEAGLSQIAGQLDDPISLRIFHELHAQADAVLAPTEELKAIHEAVGGRNVQFIPNPYPVEDSRFNFAAPASTRGGIFLGTREFDTPSRNHAAALMIALSLGHRVTVMNTSGRQGRLRLAAFNNPLMDIHEGSLPYPDYLKLMAQHALVFQLDRSAVPGQVAGDALLCGIPCVGGDGAVDRLAHPETCGFGRTTGELAGIAGKILEGWTPSLFPDTVSFSNVEKKLRALFV